MNCREAQSLMFAERDGAGNHSLSTPLSEHVAHCAACRRLEANLTAALTAWRTEASTTAVPDPEREWHAVRRRIRQGDDGSPAPSRSRRNWLTWIALPLGAAAAAVAVLVSLSRTPSVPAEWAGLTARADFVEAPGNNASTMVFVDDKSGWLIVWASDADARKG